MIKVYKYTLESHSTNTFKLPLHSNILSMQVQNEQIVIYIAHALDSSGDVAEDKETHKFYVIPTGVPVDLDLEIVQYLDTAMLYNGEIMLHVFHEKVE